MDCRTINLSGGGEPTLHPQFGKILQAVANFGFRSWIVTHGGLMHKWMDELLLADHVRISLDASEPDEHCEMHGTKSKKDFWGIHANIEQLCKRRLNGSPEVGIGYLVSDTNSSTKSLHRILQFASDAGVDFIQFRPLSEETPKRFTRHWLEVSEEIKSISPRYNVIPYLTGKRYRDVFEQREFDSCYSAFTNAVISADGSVCACCDRRDIVFGNVGQQSFKSIWLSARHREMAEKIVPTFCQRCLQCGYNKSVERFVVNNEALPELQ
jgi:radical SAM protein with 4Fe4S-binding SPASM domain